MYGQKTIEKLRYQMRKYETARQEIKKVEKAFDDFPIVIFSEKIQRKTEGKIQCARTAMKNAINRMKSIVTPDEIQEFVETGGMTLQRIVIRQLKLSSRRVETK